MRRVCTLLFCRASSSLASLAQAAATLFSGNLEGLSGYRSVLLNQSPESPGTF